MNEKTSLNQLDLREIVRNKAEKHRQYYSRLCESKDKCREMAHGVSKAGISGDELSRNVPYEDTPEFGGGLSTQPQRRMGVLEMEDKVNETKSIFKSVKVMREKYQAMLEQTSKNLQEFKLEKDKRKKDAKTGKSSEDSFLVPPASGYCSSSASAGSDDERDKTWFNNNNKHAQVKRSGSSDSAVGFTQSDDEVCVINSSWTDRNDEINYDVPNPYSPRGSIDHVNVPTRTLIEAQCFQMPINRKFSVCVSDGGDYDHKNQCDSRRQSCFTDDGEEPSGYRYWRTPSIVVSDYSDDVVGLTLEDIEYYRSQRKETSSSPDSSVHSSCSNLNYCGSTISSLDAEYILRKSFRKTSDCSTCSTLSGDEDCENNLQPVTKEEKVEKDRRSDNR